MYIFKKVAVHVLKDYIEDFLLVIVYLRLQWWNKKLSNGQYLAHVIDDI